MSAPLRITMFPARLDQLEELRLFLESFCAQAGLARENCLRLNLVLEELFTNTVSHGHGGDSEAPVWVSLASGERIEVTYEDTAPPFNPYARLPDRSPDTTIERRGLGGLGVLLTRKLSASRDYAYLHGRNCIRLALEAN
jgi:serine/threonine-protein kinase RsbW